MNMNKTVVIVAVVALCAAVVVLGINAWKQHQTTQFLESKKGESIPVA
jgi:predicted negative regulator of RcsB-dependent stress response